MIEDLLSEISERGWYLSYLRDCNDSRYYRWECTIRNAALKLVAYGQGTTCELALSMAIDGIERAEPGVLPTFTVYKTPPAVNLAEIIRRVTPAANITRRSF